MNNRNHFQQQLIKKGEAPPPSPSEETSCASSVRTIANDNDVVVVPLEQQRQQLQSQTLHLALASGASVAALIVTFVPMQLLLGFSICLFLFASLLFKLNQRARLEYTNVVQGRGLGDYLPADIYDQLVNISLHDWMMDGTFVQENQYLLLYFIPGITTEQINTYIDRLVPRHRRTLQRPGLGNFLGPQFMRLVVGEEGLQQIEGGSSRAAATTTTRGGNLVPRRLELVAEQQHQQQVEEEEQEVGLDSDDLANEYVRFWGMEPEESTETTTRSSSQPTTAARATTAVVDASSSVASNKKDDDDDDDDDKSEEEEDLEEDYNVVIDALVSGFTAYSNWTYDMMGDYARSSMALLGGTVLRTSFTFGVGAVGIGLFGMWSPQLIRNTMRLPSYLSTIALPRPSQTVLLSSTLASGATAGIMMMIMLRPNSSSNNNNNGTGDKKTTK